MFSGAQTDITQKLSVESGWNKCIKKQVVKCESSLMWKCTVDCRKTKLWNSKKEKETTDKQCQHSWQTHTEIKQKRQNWGENTFHFRADPSILAETLVTPVSDQLLTSEMKTVTQSPVSYSSDQFLWSWTSFWSHNKLNGNSSHCCLGCKVNCH